MVRSIAAGIAFLAHHPILKWIVAVLIVASLTVRPYTFVLPAYAAHVVHVDARGLGWLYASAGIGGILGAVLTALVPTRRRIMVWFGSAIVMGCGVIALGLTANGTLAFVVLAITGLATLSFIGSSNVTIQMLAPDDMRGRALSVYAMILGGLVPAGSLAIGALANAFDLQIAFAVGGACTVLATVVAFVCAPAMRRIA
jgi:predicted MFS family arabinose efflux permease